jgi:hypothetical protein
MYGMKASNHISRMSRMFLLAVLGIVLAMPSVAMAHGGVEHNTDDAVVLLYQAPISPIMRERVTSSFIFTDKSGNRLTNMPVTLTLTDTFYGDESKDKKVLTQNVKTDANGMVSFTYRYAKPDYYDIDLDFDVNGSPQEAGFLTQVRNPYKTWYSLTYIPVLFIGALGGAILARSFRYGRNGFDPKS